MVASILGVKHGLKHTHETGNTVPTVSLPLPLDLTITSGGM